MVSDAIEKADKMGTKRARVWLVTGLLLPIVQLTYLDQHGDGPVITGRLLLWIFLVVTGLFALLSGGGFGYGRQVRALVNDESAMANRDIALRWGFAASVLAGLAVYLLATLMPVSGLMATHIILTASLSVALIRFGLLEWKAHSNG